MQDPTETERGVGSGISLERADLPARSPSSVHHHPGAHFCLVVEGGFVERWRGRDRPCGASTLRISRAGLDHRIATAESPARCLVAEFASQLLDGSSLGARAEREGSVFLHSPLLLAHPGTGILGSPAILTEADLRDDLEIECWIVEVLAHADRQNRTGRSSPPPSWLLAVRERLREEYDGPFSLADLAAPAGVHPAHLARAFREHFGTTVGAYVRNRRLRYARTRIATSADALTEVALDAGFADQAHLTRAFRNRWGVSPARWRRSMQTSFKTASVPLS
jgi:AraC family transcriptional regulator